MGSTMLDRQRRVHLKTVHVRVRSPVETEDGDEVVETVVEDVTVEADVTVNSQCQLVYSGNVARSTRVANPTALLE
jgi:hypothetical protein